LLREGLASPLPPRTPPLTRRESLGRYDTKYEQYGSLGRKESLGRYRRYHQSNSSAAVMGNVTPQANFNRSFTTESQNFLPPYQTQFQPAPAPAQQPNYHHFIPELMQKESNPVGQQQIYQNSPNPYSNMVQPAQPRSPKMGRRVLQQNQSRPVSRHDTSDTSSSYHDPIPPSYPPPPPAPTSNLLQNSSLKPITSLHQVLYSNTRDNNYPRRTEIGLQTDNFPAAAPMPSGDNNINYNDRLALERNLEQLVAEQGVSVIGELTHQMSTSQIEILVRHMKERLASPDSRGSRQPIDLATIGEISLDKFLSQLSLHQTNGNNLSQENTYNNMPPMSQHQQPPMSQHQQPPMSQHQQPPMSQHQQPPMSQHQQPPMSQHQQPPPMSQHQQPPPMSQHQQPPMSQPPTLPLKQSKKHRSMSGGNGGATTSMPDLSDCVKSDSSSDDVLHQNQQHKSPHSRHKPRKSNLSGKQRSKTDLSSADPPASNNTSSKTLNVRFDPAQVPERSPHNSRHGDGHHRRHQSSRHHRHRHHRDRSSSRSRANVEVSRTGSLPRSHSYSGRSGLAEMYGTGKDRVMEDDEMSQCSTCSSSSSDSDDPYAYQLPPRRAYGGVRISYVPNDRFALSHRHLSGRRSLRMTPGPEMSPGPGAHVRGASVIGPGADQMMAHPAAQAHLAQHHLRRDTMSQDRDKDKCIIS